MSSGAPDIPARENMSNSGEDQPLVYQNRPQSRSSMAQARLVRSGDTGLVTADGHRVSGAPGEDQLHVYQSRPPSISSTAQDRIVRSDVTGDRRGQSVEGAPGFEAMGAPKNPSLIDESCANTSDNTAAALSLSQIRPAVHSQDDDQASTMNKKVNFAGKSLAGRTGKNVNIVIEYA
ncbi:hypothetical protein CTI12_AA389080 [Artemisia annua]|uniref:Uncharacterized protein n=1 Tax=Artemisia annua TaxID=35608 RepID=A0A2U1ME43_ARTAN|nr:hypothetical protein CTI12_AA389080 [Artemisia annua]